mmetsp:Transcript_60530/g.70142  ORF Transcript_60530/g.70142 Transcript_60530/m.70142 type:complete len:214 (+) Transcript_60530:555-1196(+)
MLVYDDLHIEVPSNCIRIFITISMILDEMLVWNSRFNSNFNHLLVLNNAFSLTFGAFIFLSKLVSLAFAVTARSSLGRQETRTKLNDFFNYTMSFASLAFSGVFAALTFTFFACSLSFMRFRNQFSIVHILKSHMNFHDSWLNFSLFRFSSSATHSEETAQYIGKWIHSTTAARKSFKAVLIVNFFLFRITQYLISSLNLFEFFWIASLVWMM